MLWYTQEGRLAGESRKCQECITVETRNVEMELRPAVLQPTTSVYPVIFDEEGKLLLVRRSLDIKSSPGEWELPGGGVSAINASNTTDERIVIQELTRIVKDRVGISIFIPLPMVSMYPAILKGGGDWAFAIIIGVLEEKPSKGETIYVSSAELRRLAEGPEGNRLVSGWGKRMCRLALVALINSPNPWYVKESKEMLSEIQAEWK
jgi:hypothetical protein